MSQNVTEGLYETALIVGGVYIATGLRDGILKIFTPLWSVIFGIFTVVVTILVRNFTKK